MSYIVIIRETTPRDAPYINELVKNAYLSNVNTAWMNALFKEVIIIKPFFSQKF